MPSKKPRIQALVSETTYEKFKRLCDIEDRSESNLGGRIITDYINNYESKHGNIVIGEIKQSGKNNTINF